MFDAMFVIVPIIIGLGIVFTMLMIFSPKFTGKILGKQVKSMRYMMEDSKDDLAKIGGIGIGIEKQILDENEDVLTDIAHRQAKIKSVGIKSAAKAIKEGLTESDSIYCKYCGSKIDSDSKFCKKCGKEQ